jgi:hypothetical protein
MVERILNESQSLEGTLGASYLASRGLTRYNSPNLRFHPGIATQVKIFHRII